MSAKGGRLKVGFYAGLEITEKRPKPYKRRRGIGRTSVLSIEGFAPGLFFRFWLKDLAWLAIRKVRA